MLVFPAADGLMRPKDTPLQDVLRRALARAGLAGAPLVVAQRILRHSDPRLTASFYSRVDLGDLRAGLNRIDIPAIPKSVPAKDQ